MESATLRVKDGYAWMRRIFLPGFVSFLFHLLFCPRIGFDLADGIFGFAAHFVEVYQARDDSDHKPDASSDVDELFAVFGIAFNEEPLRM